MLSYQHGYHAGNFADVIKHVGLTHLLSYLILKEKPLFYLETHSGKGLYDLMDNQAEKTKEYRQGISLLWADRHSLPPVFNEYFQILSKLNPNNTLRYYPGSPFLAINMLRAQDRMYFCELHPKEFAVLRLQPRLKKKVHFSNSDGVEALKALLPPPEKRGLIFIDPSFEVKEEYKEIPQAIREAYCRFETGTFCLWYPLVNKRLSDKLHRGMKEIGAKNALRMEFNLTKSPMEGMSGCGLWVINPPFIFADQMKTVFNALKTYFNPGISSYVMEAS